MYSAELKALWTDPYLLTGAIYIGVSNISHNPIKGFKEHGLHRAINRGFKPIGNNVVILNEHGKIVTVYGPPPTGNYQE